VTDFVSNVDSWMDVVSNVWVGLVLISVAVIPSIISARNHKGIKKIQDQVVNGHKDPLRSDLDKVIKSLSDTSDKVDSISHGFTSLREELIQEEIRRRAGIKELREDFDRKFADLSQRFVR